MFETTNLIGNLVNWWMSFGDQIDHQEELLTFLNLIGSTTDAFESLMKGLIPEDQIPAPLSEWTKGLQDWYTGVTSGLNTFLVDKVIEQLTAAGAIEDAIAFSHSGFFAPLLGAIERMDYDIHTLINYEGPHLNPNAYLQSTHLERIINVWGTAPNKFVTGQYTELPNPENLGLVPLDFTKKKVEVGDFGPPFLMDENRLANFDSARGIANINIKIIGARHNDFSYKDYKTDINGNDLPHIPENELWNRNPYEPEQIAREINFKTNKFMRELYEAAEDEDLAASRINAFLLDLQSRGAAYQDGDIWVVDAKALPYLLEYAY